MDRRPRATASRLPTGDTSALLGPLAKSRPWAERYSWRAKFSSYAGRSRAGLPATVEAYYPLAKQREQPDFPVGKDETNGPRKWPFRSLGLTSLTHRIGSCHSV